MDWIEWKGGVIPVSLNARVEVKLRSGEIVKGAAIMRGWKHHGWQEDVMAYREIAK